MGQLFGQLDYAKGRARSGVGRSRNLSGRCFALLHASRPERREHGFTLVELMVTVFVAAILVTIAVPSFRSIIASSQLRSAADDVYSAVNTARLEAIKRNATIQLCGSPQSTNGTGTLATNCSTQSAGAIVSSTGVGVIRSGLSGISSPVQLKNGLTALQFDSNGIAHAVGSTANYAGTIADICTSALSTNNHRFVKLAAGSIVYVDDPSNGACP